MSLMGFEFTVVIVSKHEVKVTIGAKVPLMMIFAELAGLPVTQARFDVMTQRTLSPATGLKVKVGKFVPALAPLSFH